MSEPSRPTQQQPTPKSRPPRRHYHPRPAPTNAAGDSQHDHSNGFASTLNPHAPPFQLSQNGAQQNGAVNQQHPGTNKTDKPPKPWKPRKFNKPRPNGTPKVNGNTPREGNQQSSDNNTITNTTTTTTTTTTETSQVPTKGTEPHHRGRREGSKPQPRKPHQYTKKPSPNTPAPEIPDVKLEGYTELSSQIINKLHKGTYECLICFDSVKRNSPIWGCSNCYALFHEKCIQAWKEKSIQSDGSWRCPGCQGRSKEEPKAKCYCGKTDGLRNQMEGGAGWAFMIPHSCGEVCGKPGVNDCPHSCSLICHPGPCPPCAAMGPIKPCFCGKTQYRLRCGLPDHGKSCGNTCDRDLPCGRHLCQKDCHPGDCGQCEEVVMQTCYCGKKKEERLCSLGDPSTGEESDEDYYDDEEDESTLKASYEDGDEDEAPVVVSNRGPKVHFSCGSTCDKLLACGNHRCTETCHSGPCPECTLLPSKVHTCPCGATPITNRKSCSDPIPTCKNVCNKLLACDHACKSTCHLGDCPPCKEEVEVKCRCTKTTFKVPCCEALPPAPKGTRPKPKQFLCDKICEELRGCGRHRCGVRCCPDVGPENHVCPLICGRKLKCGLHKCEELCHKGRCGKCYNTDYNERVCACGKTVQYPPIECGTPPLQCFHPCTKTRPCGHGDPPGAPHLCHHGPCPPCTILVEKYCSGGHGVRKLAQCHLTEVSCGRICGQPMPCGLHTCSRHCHSGACMVSKDGAPVPNTTSKSAAVTTQIPCGQPCGVRRPLCEHTCQAPCHPNQPCPNVLCTLPTKIFCPCERQSKIVKCMRGGPDNLNTLESLQCDEQCEIEKRNKQLAEAFGISSTNNKAPVFSDFLIGMGKAGPVFIQKVEKAFADFIMTVNQKCTLPAMDRVQRQIVHELAKYYFLETTSTDREPNRHIILAKTRNTKVPSVLLSALVTKDVHKPSIITTSNSSYAASASTQADKKTYAIHIYDLNPNIKTQHLISFLHPFNGEYQLQWLDDFNALAIFYDEKRMRTALNSLSGGLFHVKVYKDQTDMEVKANYQPEKTVPTEKVVKLRPAAKDDDKWREDNNFFAILAAAEAKNAAANTTTITKAPVIHDDVWGSDDDEPAARPALVQSTDDAERQPEKKTIVLPVDVSLDDDDGDDKQ